MPDGLTQPDMPAAEYSGDPLEQIRRRLVRLAVKLVWHREDAEDIAQEAFRIAAAAGVSPGEDRFLPWMIRTVSNLCLNQRRRRKTESLEPYLERASGDSPDELAGHAERLERVRGAIGKLPDQQRVALVLRTMEQMSYEEVARVMELSAGAVRTHVHLARQRLAAMLGEDA